MSLASPYIESYYVADGVTTSFAFGQGFTALSEANVKCIIYFEDGTNCVPTFTVDMTTGYITIITLTKPDGTVLTVPPAGSIVRVFRDTPEQQNVTASQLQNYTAKQLERIFDSVVAMIQEISYLARRKTVRLTETQRDVSIEQLTEEKDQGVLFWDFESGKIKAADFGQDEVVKSETVDRLVYIQSEGKIYFIPKGTTTQIPIGSATVHNELSGRNAPDCHPESAITNLTTHLQELRDKDTVIEAKADAAVETANQAYSKAETAEGVANSAYEKSVEAERVVNTFDGRLIQAESDAINAKTTAESTQLVVDSHVTNKSNPHEVTKAQVGLGNVDNTSDLDKPISTATQAALNAQQEEIDALSGRGRFLALWNCATGLAESNPPESPYPYKAGDYFVVGTVSSATPAVNYKPDGSSYTTGVASTVIETNEVSVNDTYFYDGTVWKLQSNAQKEVSFSALAGSPYDNTALGNALDSKQNTLTAGTNISIVNDVISSTAQESFFRGNWNNWIAVPTSANNYPADYKGNKTPTYGDFLIVKDASDYVGSGKNYNFKYKTYHQLSINNGDYATIYNGYTYTDGDVIFTISKQSYTYSIVCNVDVYLNGVLVPANTSIVSWSEGQDGYTFDIVATDTETYEGEWRFAYYGVWGTDGKLGWKPEYLVEDVLPTADSATAGIAKLYNTTGANTDGSMTQSSVTTALGGKQDTLTAGTNISIVNNVISATTQESFFRGKFLTWSDVPASDSGYTPDYNGSRTPTENDYMVVEDSSGYVKSGAVLDFYLEPVNPQSGAAGARFACEYFDITVLHTQATGDGIVIGTQGHRILVKYSGATWHVFPYDIPLIVEGVEIPVGTEAFSSWYGNVSIETFVRSVNYASSGTYEGTWRFAYHGTWSVDGKNGWVAEYQVEDVLPIADSSTAGIAKLYTTTGNNTDGSMTQDSVTTALSGKQDTLTAGTNIDITNNVISATSVESFFRGKWNTWSNVPTEANLYPSDYKGSHIPTESDYMVVEDASGFVPGLDIELFIPQTGTRQFTLGGEQKLVPNYPDTVSWVLPDITITASFHNGTDSWFTANKTVKCDNVIYAAGDTFAKVRYYGNPGPTIYYSNSESLSGAWRFSYRGTWATDNISGWKPEYQVEDVLPTADSSTAGIAKLYTTTGSNTDGAIDQNGTTTAINTAVSTHNTASNAHSNIRGTANGLATLDGNAKVPLSQMNDALLGNVSYQGLWNAATNDPFLPNPAGELPTGYTQYGWIKSVSGTPYIDTGISYDYDNEDEITVETKLNYLSTARAGYGSFGFTSGNGSIFIWKNWQGVPTVNVGGLTASIASETDTVVSMKVDKILGQKSITIDGTTTYGTISSFANLNIYVLSANNGGTPSSNQSYVKFYYVNISKSGTLLARLLPCKRNSDDAVGMYDTVRNTFYPVTGGVAEVGGSIEIPKGHYYITSTAGTQFGIHFEVGDWVISTGISWTKVDNTDAVSSVEGRTGNVTVINDNASTGATTYTWSADKLATEFANVPTVNNPTITITQGGVTKGSFTLNQSSGDTIALDTGGGSYTAGDGIDITNDVISVSNLDCGTM